jgi:hypothetical protein
MRTVRGAGLFDLYFGKGWLRHIIIYGFPAISALLIAVGIFSSFIEVSDTLMMYSQPTWVPGARTGVRIAVMDNEGEFVPITELSIVLTQTDGDREAVLFDGPAHGTKAASLTLPVPDWPAAEYQLAIRAQTTQSTKKSILPIRLDGQYSGEKPSMTRQLLYWREEYGSQDFMEPGWSVKVELIPEAGQVASSLPNLLYVRTTNRAGAPVSTKVRMTLAEGYISGEFPSEVTTDSLGLAAVLIFPTYISLVIGVEVVDPDSGSTAAEGVGSASIECAPHPSDVSGTSPECVPQGENGPAPEGGGTPAAEVQKPAPSSRGRVVLPIGPQGIRLRSMVPNPIVGEPMSVRVYSVGQDMTMFTDLFKDDIWLAAFGDSVDGQSSQVTTPIPRSPGLHVVQAYSSPVPAIFQEQPGQPDELMSASMSSAHVWARPENESATDSILALSSELRERNVDRQWVSHLTAARLDAGGFNPGQAMALMLARLDGAMYPPMVAATSREHDKSSATSLQDTIRTTVIVALSVVGAVIVFALGFLTYLSLRTGHGGKQPSGGSETPLTSHDAKWLRRQVFQMGMVIAVVIGMFGLLAVLVAYLRWQMG